MTSRVRGQAALSAEEASALLPSEAVPSLTDFVEKLAGLRRVMVREYAAPPSGQFRLRHRDELGELPEVLDGGCEVELVAGPVRSSESEPVEAQDALEVGEQHLDFLPQLSGCSAFLGHGNLTGHIASALAPGDREYRGPP